MEFVEESVGPASRGLSTRCRGVTVAVARREKDEEEAEKANLCPRAKAVAIDDEAAVRATGRGQT